MEDVMSTLPRLVPPCSAEAPELRTLRQEVRDFLDEQRAADAFTPYVDSWISGWDEDFTAALAERGWLGLTVPQEYGGHGKSFLHRYVVTEELLAAGAPVAAHWVADRQIAPSLLKYGTEEQRHALLPGIVRGELFFAIGMSEPDSGSDLASVRTRAVQVDGGWRITGTKVWTSGAHRSHALMLLARSAPVDPNQRHAGLSQFIVGLDSPGLTIRPILWMNGEHHFNEVSMEDVFVPDDRVFGQIGAGWKQVTSELGFERSGPERTLSTFPVLAGVAERMSRGELPPDPALGRLVARVAGLRQMSAAVAGQLQRHLPADVPAAVVKVLGTAAEGDVADLADRCCDDSTDLGFRDLVQVAVDHRPGFTIRGGTNEILRGVIARELGLR
jgi:alkylation response protein AidB-like acyl-CoA dehydrogenase